MIIMYKSFYKNSYCLMDDQVPSFVMGPNIRSLLKFAGTHKDSWIKVQRAWGQRDDREILKEYKDLTDFVINVKNDFPEEFI